MESLKLIGVMGSGLIGTDPFAEDSWSGSSSYFFRECSRQAILQRAFGVEVSTALRLPLMLRNFSLDRNLWRQKFYLDPTYYDLLSRRIARSLSATERDCPLLQIGGIYSLRSLVAPGRRIFSYHDGNLAQAMRSPHFPKSLLGKRTRAALVYEQEVYNGIDVIFTMSEYLRASFVNDFGVPESKVKTIGAGVNLDSIPERVEDKDYDTKRLLFVGVDFERKGGLDLLRAFKKVRAAHGDATLTIVGPHELPLSSDPSDGVIHAGFLSKKLPAHQARLKEIFRESSLFVMPSRYEPFGIAPLEAMVHQIPAVLTNAWAFPEMVEPGVNGELVDCADPDGLAEKIIGLLNDPDRLHRMGRRARDLALRKFTWPAVVQKMRAELSAA